MSDIWIFRHAAAAAPEYCNLAPASSATYDPSLHACWGDVLISHPADPFQAYPNLLATLRTTHHNQPLLTINSGGSRMVVTIPMLVRSRNILLDTNLYSLHSHHSLPWQSTKEALMRLPLRGMDYGPLMLSGSTSLLCVLSPPQMAAALAASMM